MLQENHVYRNYPPEEHLNNGRLTPGSWAEHNQLGMLHAAQPWPPHTQSVYQPTQRFNNTLLHVLKQPLSTALPTAFGQSPYGWPETSAYKTGTPGASVPYGQQALPPALVANTPWSPLPCAGPLHPAAPFYSSPFQAAPTNYSQWPQNELNWASRSVYNPRDLQQQPPAVNFHNPYNHQQYDHAFMPSALPVSFPTLTEDPNRDFAPLRIRPKL